MAEYNLLQKKILADGTIKSGDVLKVDSFLNHQIDVPFISKLGLDQRIINPMLPDEETTKVNQCVANILQYWRDGEADKLTQLVFCDSVAIRCYK